MQISRGSFALSAEELDGAKLVDVCFDGHRVWSVSISGADAPHAWPAVLRARLTGIVTVSVRSSSTGAMLVEREVAFDDSPERLALVDGRGRWLAMTKWGNLGPVNDGRDDGVRERLVDDAAVVVDALSADGHELYLVGGALLGMVREGKMLGHDDDVDLAFLSEHSDPSDLGLESYRMERALQAQGFSILRHSLAHIAVQFFDEDGRPERHVDVFTGFFRDGLYNQPFALRGPGVTRDSLLPTHPREVHGAMLPEPNHPEAWLEYAYGPGWKVPDPSFVFPDTRGIVARFEGWFGSFNNGRDAWNSYYVEHPDGAPEGDGDAAVELLLDALPTTTRILDVGCGDGHWTRKLAARGHRVTGVDFSPEALVLADGGEHEAGANVDFRYVNINDRAQMLELGVHMLGTGDEWVVFAHHLAQGLTHAGRHKLFQFLSLVLRGSGFALLVNDVDIAHEFDHAMPGTWHLPTAWLRDEASAHPLAIDELATGERADGPVRRGTATVRITRAESALTHHTRETL